MTRYDIINNFIQKYDYKSYLEVGCQWGQCFKEVKCISKMSVDPNPNSSAIYKVSSDFFFEYNSNKFDIIFIDGLHLEEQVDKDIENSLKFLNDNGTVICHDCVPKNEKEQLETWDHKGAWTGTVWRSFVKLRATRTDLEMFVVDTDHGCGIIRNGHQNLITIPEVLTYKDFETNKKEWLNLIPVDNFK